MDATANTNASTVVRVRVRACVHMCKILLLHIFVCECSLTPGMTGLFEVKSNNRTLLRRVYVCVPECRTFVSIPRGEFWMYKFVISPQHFMVLSRFSAPHKPIRTVKGTPRHHLVLFFFFLVFFCISSLFPRLPLPPDALPVLFQPYRPSLLLPFSAFLPLFHRPSIFLPLHSLPPCLSSSLCFRLVLSSPYYITAVGESVSDSNLSCPIISCCSVAELKDGLLIFFKGRDVL